jgi:nitrous oxidase accessory protein NosD
MPFLQSGCDKALHVQTALTATRIIPLATITVQDTSTLLSALKVAKGGDTIQLTSGTYDGAYFKHMTFSGAGVTITSANPGDPAVLSNTSLINIHGVTFTNLELTGKAPAYAGFIVRDSSDIHFDRVHVHGSLDGDASNDVNGMQIVGSTNVTVTNSELEQLGRAIVVDESTKVTLSGNYVHDLRTDGFDFAEVGFIKVTDNIFRNFTAVGDDHPDAIQFFTTGTVKPSHDIQISGNVIMRGEQGWTQGIFLKDNVGGLSFERVSITDNLVVGTGHNGIRVWGAKDLTISNNELISFAGDYMKTFFYVQNADQVSVTGNTASNIDFLKVTNLAQSGNVINKAVSDAGAEALQRWVIAHPRWARRLAPFLVDQKKRP